MGSCGTLDLRYMRVHGLKMVVTRDKLDSVGNQNDVWGTIGGHLGDIIMFASNISFSIACVQTAIEPRVLVCYHWLQPNTA